MTVFDRFRPSLVFLGVSGMAGEKTAHRPPSRLAPSPPSKIKAPWRFSLSPGKNPSLSEIPYQSPKKCLKTQITTFSILKFSPKTKNTPVLAVFTLFLPSSYCSHHHPVACSIVIQLLSSSHCHHYHPTVYLFEDSTGQDISVVIVYLPHPLAFWSSTGILSDFEIPQIIMSKVPQKRFVLKFFSEFVLVF